MPDTARSTLSEVSRKLAEVSFSILNIYDDKRWVNASQLIYSTVPGWETSYEAYLSKNAKKTDATTANVKFPFAALTRGPTQDSFKIYNKAFTAHEDLLEGATSVKSVRIRPVRVQYNLAIYDQRLEDIEAFADIIITQGHATQKLDYQSEVLEQPTSISFNFEEPIHEMIPGRDDKRKGIGFVYGLNIPITVDCVLGIKSEEKIIEEAISRVLTRIPDPLPDDITQEPDVEIEIINDQTDC